MKRQGESHMPRKILAFVIVIVTLALGWMFFSQPHFDSHEWISQGNDCYTQGSYRSSVIDSVQRLVKEKKMNREDVIKLLGAPIPQTANSSWMNEWDMVYRLGMERGVFGLDAEYLVIRFDRKTGTVTECRIKVD